MVKKNIILFLALLLADQFSKLIVAATNPSADFFLFAFTFVQNTGAVWGLFQNSNVLFIWISIIAIGVLAYAYDKIPEKAKFFYTLILAGIIGNLIDRLFRGYVVDFIDFKIWPVFNFADSFIVIGVIGMVFLLWNEK